MFIRRGVFGIFWVIFFYGVFFLVILGLDYIVLDCCQYFRRKWVNRFWKFGDQFFYRSFWFFFLFRFLIIRLVRVFILFFYDLLGQFFFQVKKGCFSRCLFVVFCVLEQLVLGIGYFFWRCGLSGFLFFLVWFVEFLSFFEFFE